MKHPPRIRFDPIWFLVDGAINLKREAQLGAVEVDNVTADDLLASKLQTEAPSIAN